MTTRDYRGRSTPTFGDSRAEDLGVPAAGGVVVHAPIAANDPALSFKTGITQPDRPRAVTVSAAVGYDGGNVTILGLDVRGVPVQEVFLQAAILGGPVLGVVAFASITEIRKAVVGTVVAAASFSYNNRLGLQRLLFLPVGVLAVDGTTEIATWNVAGDSVLPTTAPNGVRRFSAIYHSAGPT